MTIDRRRHAAMILAFLATALVLGCSSDLDTDNDNDNLPAPTLHAGEAIATCSPAGGVPIELDLLRTIVTTGFGGPGPTPVNNIDIRGTATGLPAGEEVYVALLAFDGPCRVLSTGKATVDATTGDLRALVNIRTDEEFHVIAMSGTSDANGRIGCTAAGCLDLSDPGPPTLLAISGVSNVLDVRLE